MKFQVGDKIILLHSNEEGEVIDIINKDMVMVDVGGVKFPAYNDQLDFPYFRRFTEKKKEAKKTKVYIDGIKKEKQIEKYHVENGMWLCFMPVFDKDIFEEDIVDYFRLYLVNNTDDLFSFEYKLIYSGIAEFDLKNEISPFSDFYLHDIPLDDLNDAPKFELLFRLKTADKKRVDHFETVYKIKPKKLYEQIEILRQKQQASFSNLLFTFYPGKSEDKTEGPDDTARGAGFEMYDAAKAKQNLPPARTVVDLHIEKLAENWNSLSNFEKLDLQLREFEKYYELAILHHQPALIVVHGVGSGKLRDEIHELLRNRREVKSFINQYHPSFGFGATEIYFQY